MAMFDARAAAEAAAARQGDELFEFVGLDGATHAMPPATAMTAGQIRRFTEGDFGVLTEVVGPEVGAAIEELPMGVFDQLVEAWMEASEPVGKSGSASPATRTGGTPSKRTSRSGASNSPRSRSGK